ncbi:MvaI/BcnI family restriction endonuclease [Halobacteriovorax sp. JY17]|uniref:MvaI/BcnI family restriction endonuclease n=1 Tax=Halobacteriovorax sp. JY17 TaxID=2014617 RepID=UPI000C69D8AA|nr:MvaI/BcnI family restriction endonuclease [Halobacteriovorax sp. JY17]PIK15105.1 MAG: hypothetical protein CES88_12285 [Halobacteriovorax sp. JY17]
MKVKDVVKELSDLGCQNILIKKLSYNDSSQAQINTGGEKGMKYLPFTRTELSEQTSKKKKASDYIFVNYLNFSWITDSGVHNAPNAKFILYPQYPESRLSGFLLGCKGAPREVIADRHDNRFLILSFNQKGESFGYVNFIDEDFNSFLNKHFESNEKEIFYEASISSLLSDNGIKISIKQSIQEIKDAIKFICEQGWIKSCRLNKKGEEIEYKARNGGGYTLEAKLGVIPNSDAAPDYKGWELKQHSGRAVSLFTPEPDAGLYNELGVAEFIRRFGYPPKNGQKERLNFGGVHKITDKDHHHLTSLKLVVHGYDDGNFTSEDGYIGLSTRENEVVAKWTFTKLLGHWQRKHARTCYVKSERKEIDGAYFYKYSPNIDLGIESTFKGFLNNLLEGVTYLDPGSNLKKEDGAWKTKARSQFRIKEKDLPKLYKIYSAHNAYE